MLPQALAVEEAANDAGPGDEGEEADADSSYDVSAPEDFFASLPPPANVKVRRSRCAHAWQALRWRRLPTVQLLSSQVKTAEYVSSAVDLQSCPKPVFPEFAVIGRSNVGKSSLINMLTGKRKLALVSKQPGAFGGCMLRPALLRWALPALRAQSMAQPLPPAGKTRCINHFIINGSWYLVDLPGYGYAKVAKEQRLKWNDFTKDYFLNRDTLVTVLLLVDASIPPTKIDMECLTWMAEAQVPFILVVSGGTHTAPRATVIVCQMCSFHVTRCSWLQFTKCDKKKKGLDFRANVDAFKKEMLKEWEYLPPCILTSAEQGLGKQQLLSLLAQLRDHYNRNKIA